MNFLIKLEKNGKMPTKGSKEAGGWDLYSAENVLIEPGRTQIVKTGISTEFDSGYVGVIYDRSSLGIKGICRFAGVIDADFRKEWGVVLHNASQLNLKIDIGDRIAQVIFHEIPDVQIQQVNKLSDSKRTGGWGSTGK